MFSGTHQSQLGLYFSEELLGTCGLDLQLTTIYSLGAAGHSVSENLVLDLKTKQSKTKLFTLHVPLLSISFGILIPTGTVV